MTQFLTFLAVTAGPLALCFFVEYWCGVVTARAVALALGGLALGYFVGTLR